MSHRDGGRTGVVLFAGLLLLGFGIGLAVGQPGIGLVIGLGTWFTTMGFLLARSA